MQKTIIKELIHRRVPQIIGSYFIGAITLLFFIDWLVVKYGFSETYTSLALFGLASIIPSVIILAYFHGAPGKDEWTNIEKFGIPINIIFIAISLFFVDKYLIVDKNIKEVADTFVVHISNGKELINRMKDSDIYDDFTKDNRIVDYVDDKRIEDIRINVYSSLNAELINHDINLVFPENNLENSLIDKFASFEEISEIDWTDSLENEAAKKKYEPILEDAFEHFENKINRSIDKFIYINPIEFKDKKDDSWTHGIFVINFAKFNKKKNGKNSFSYSGHPVDYQYNEHKITEGFNELTKTYINIFKKKLIGLRYGYYIGEIQKIIDEDLVTIKIFDPMLIKGIISGTILKHPERRYQMDKENIHTKLDEYLRDFNIVNNYLKNHPESYNKTISLYEIFLNTEDYTYESLLNESIDSYNYEISKKDSTINGFIGEGGSRTEHRSHLEFKYDLKVLDIKDDIITAKVINKLFPISIPRVGDYIKINDE